MQNRQNTGTTITPGATQIGKRSIQRLSPVTGEKLIQPTTANTPVKKPNQEDMKMLDSLCRIAGLAKLYSSLQRPSVFFKV